MTLRERNYRNLKVWTAAHALALRVYRVTDSLPDTERFGLVTQLRRATASVAANLAEGSGRSSAQVFANYVDIAYASATELDYHLLLAHDLGYLDAVQHESLSRHASEVQRMLAALRRSLGGRTAVRPTRRAAVPFR